MDFTSLAHESNKAYNIANIFVDNIFVVKGIYMFVGRENELQLIHSRLETTGFELGVIYGQRRIGCFENG